MKHFLLNKTGTRQCTRAIWSTFAEIHSNHPGALMHYLGFLLFPLRICDSRHVHYTHESYLIYPNRWKHLVLWLLLSLFRLVGLLKRRMIEPSQCSKLTFCSGCPWDYCLKFLLVQEKQSLVPPWAEVSGFFEQSYIKNTGLLFSHFKNCSRLLTWMEIAEQGCRTRTSWSSHVYYPLRMLAMSRPSFCQYSKWQTGVCKSIFFARQNKTDLPV